MKIETTPALISIQTADYQSDYKLHIHFNDGADKTVDFKPFLTQSQHPSIRAYLQPEKFQGFHVAHGDLVWGDYDLCFPVSDLYQGRV